MEQSVAILFLVLAFLALLGSGVWVALSLLAVGFLGMVMFTDAPAGLVLATSTWGASHSWALAALPLFIWMGEILVRSRLAEDLFEGLAPWLGWLPGKLLHINVVGCGIFAASSGSSAATAATIGRMSIPELRRRGYDERMIIGTLAGSGTLGLLIPPSIILIVYGVATEQSIARLFVAGILPGLLLIVLFMGYVVVWALRNPGAMPPVRMRSDWRQLVASGRRLAPVLVLIAAVIGSIYSGIASPTDAAAVGVMMALVLSWASGTLDRRGLIDSLLGATRTSCMIAFILVGATYLTVAMAFSGIPGAMAGWIATYDLSPVALLAVLTIFFIVLGCFLDGISVVVLTTAVTVPMIEQAGIDLVWFGVFLVLVVEMSQITPPVGFNLFVIRGLTGQGIMPIARAALPFFLLLLLAVAIVIAFPQIATYLPERMGR